MKGDFTRFSFDRRRHYGGVLMQQGRAPTDADTSDRFPGLATLREPPGHETRRLAQQASVSPASRT